MYKALPLVCTAAASAMLLSATPSAAAPWVRSFAISNYELALYFGGKPGASTADPGTDCPKGSNPDLDYAKILKAPWRSDAQIAAMLKPLDGKSSPRAKLVKASDVTKTGEPERYPHGDGLGYALATRGFAPNIQSYVNPFTAVDEGQQEVTGKIAEGFDLDGNPRTGFTSPTGERGIDNGYYRVMGCVMNRRGAPYTSYFSGEAHEMMIGGLYTVVLRVSGNQDPMNDANATVEIGYSPDHLVRNGEGKILADYSYRMDKGPRYSRLAAKIKNGVVETAPVEQLRLMSPALSPAELEEDTLYKGRIRLQMTKDGGVTGLIGGYRDWLTIYTNETFQQPHSGAQSNETYRHQNRIAIYYSLKRNADGMPDPQTGRNTAISTAYRLDGVPAFVVDSALPEPLPPQPGLLTAAVFRTVTRRAVITKRIQAADFDQYPRYEKSYVKSDGPLHEPPKGWDAPISNPPPPVQPLKNNKAQARADSANRATYLAGR